MKTSLFALILTAVSSTTTVAAPSCTSPVQCYERSVQLLEQARSEVDAKLKSAHDQTEAARAEAAAAKNLADTVRAEAAAAQAAAAAAQNTANAGYQTASRWSVRMTNGSRSCQDTCWEASQKCVVAWAGEHPVATWTCDKAPDGNLLCLCY